MQLGGNILIEIGFLRILEYNHINKIKEGDIVNIELFYRGEMFDYIKKKYLISRQDYNQLLIYEKCVYNYNNACFINNPSEFIQLLLIAHRVANIENIKYSTYFVQKIVVEMSNYNLGFIQNPYKKIQIDAINQNPWNIGNIDNPSLEVCQHALYLNKDVINVIRSNIDCYDQLLEFYNFLYRV
jgi:hypothetical protein